MLTDKDTIHHADALDLLRAQSDASIDMVLCDLPYGILESIDLQWDNVIPFAPMWAELKRVIKRKRAIILTARQPFTSALIVSNPSWFRYEWVWCKPQGTDFLNANRKPLSAHENVLVFAEGQTPYYPQFGEGEAYTSTSNALHIGIRDKSLIDPYTITNNGTRHPTTVLEFEAETGLHPTQKPVALFEYLIRTYTQEGDTVLDMTCGSGTTAVACVRSNRHFICGDLSAEYVNLARQRLASTDPYQDKPIKGGGKQLSLFGGDNG